MTPPPIWPSKTADPHRGSKQTGGGVTRRPFIRLLALIFFLTVPLGTLSGYPEIVERILAVVNDEIVTEQDLQIVMAPVLAQYRATLVGKEYEDKANETRREFLHKIIEDRLILSEAKRRQVIVSDAEVDEMIEDVRGKFPNKEVFTKAIQEQGLTEKKLWNRFRDQLMTQKLVAYEVRSRVSVSPGEVSEYYKAHMQEYAQGDRVRLQQILVRSDSRTEDEAKTFAESLVAQMKEGKPFEEIAKTYSEGIEAKEGGEMGWMEKGQLLGEIDTQVFSLKEGEITLPLKSTLGYHIFRVAERKESSIRPLSEVRDKIYDALFKQKMRERLDKWIEDLKKNAYISIR